MNQLNQYLSKEAKNIHKKSIKLLKQYRKDREEFQSHLTNPNWISWTNSPHFWLNWVRANVSDINTLKYMVDIVLKFDKTGKWFDLRDILVSVYQDPDTWLNTKFGLNAMIDQYGMPE